MSWERTRLKYLSDVPIANGIGEPAEFDDPAWPRYIRTTDIASPRALRDDTFVSLSPAKARLAPVERNDILMSAAGTIGRTYLHASEDRACYAGYLVRFRPRQGVEPRFVSYWTQTTTFLDQVNVGAVRSTIDNFSAGKYQNLLIDLPDLATQLTIANYLDAETARIDAIVVARRRTAELAALRLDVYTRQLVSQNHEDEPYSRVPLRRRWSVIDCKHRTPRYEPDGYPVVSPGDATAGRLDLSRCTRFVGQADFDDLTDGQRRPRRGDIIYARNASIGIASYVDTDEPFTMGQDVCLVRSDHQDQRYLSYVLNTFGMDQLDEQKIGTTFSRINVARVLDLSVPCPPIADQRRIADELDVATARASEFTDATQRQIDLLLERRKALITAAVTGQIDIPGVAA